MTIWPDAGWGQASASNPVRTGVRPILKAALSLDPASPYAKSKDGPVAVDLRVTVRISDHAPEADFFGVVVVDFAQAKAEQPGLEKTIWQARRCHQNRGLPKVSVTDIRGTIGEGEGRAAILAIPRHIGKLIPADEIIVTRTLPRSFGAAGTQLTIRAQTKVTRLLVDLHLSVPSCEL